MLSPALVSAENPLGIGVLTSSGDLLAPFGVLDLTTPEPDDTALGLAVERGGVTTRLLGPGDAAPDTTGVIERFSSFFSLTHSGRIAVRIQMQPGVGGVVGRNASGVWGGPIDDVRLIARDDDPAPGTGGAPFDVIGAPVTNGHGDIVFTSRLGRGPGVVSSNNSGVWRSREGASVEAVAREGDAAPGAGGAVFGDFIDARLFAGGDGGFAILASLAPGAGVDASNDTGLWRVDGESIELLARAGDTAPGTHGAVFERFEQIGGVDSGEYAFIGVLREGVGGVVEQNNRGLWGVDASGEIGLIQRTGQSVTVENFQGETEALVITGIGFLANEGLADNGWLGYAVSFDGGASAVYRTRLGEDASGCAADLDGDGDVDLGDFGFFGMVFGLSLVDAGYEEGADFDGDGVIDLSDFGLFGAQFGRTGCTE